MSHLHGLPGAGALITADHIADHCWCGAPAAGVIGARGLVPAHICSECPEHCQAAADAARCEFGICRAAATVEVDNPETGPVHTCATHAMPAATWGVAHAEPEIVVRRLPVGHPAA